MTRRLAVPHLPDARRPADAAGETGGVGLLTVLAGLLTTVVGLLMLVAALDVAGTAARARTAADAAALAAAGASPLAGGDGDARGAAARLAVANGARLVGCCDPPPGAGHGGAVVALVEVEVRPQLGPLGLAGIRARAAAGLRPGEAPVETPDARQARTSGDGAHPGGSPRRYHR